MRLRRFRAATAAEALRKVKDALGGDAVILATQHEPDGEVEITAAVDVDALPRGRAVDDPPAHRGVAEAARDATFLAPPGEQSRAAGRRAPSRADAVPCAEAGEEPSLALVYRELRQLRLRVSAIDELLRDRDGGGDDLGAAGRDLAATLVAGGLARRVATRIAERFEREMAVGTEQRDAMAASLAQSLPFAEGRSAARVSIFVGPSGAGKTTTIAKLAAVPALAGRGRRPGLVVADAHRIGAAEQLAAYARLLDVPLRAVHDANGMRGALEDLAGCDPILVDTAGFAADGERRRELAAIAAAIEEPTEVTAVMSATASARTLDRAWQAVSLLAPGSCVITKLDECDELGDACTWLSDAGVPLRWLGTGPDVPGGLVAASGASLRRWLVAA